MKYFLRSSKPIKNRVRTRSMGSLEDQCSGSKRKRFQKHDTLRMQKSKRRKGSKHANGVDFISNMPDPILHSILQRLPTTEEAIRTSILSTRWRYLGPSMSSVDIDIRAKKSGKTKFRKFVKSILSNKTGLNLDSLRLDCAGYFDMATVRRWIQAAVKRKVKRLDLMFFATDIWRHTDSIPLPNCLLTCESLEELRLYPYGRAMHLPEPTGFRALRVLELKRIFSFDMHLVEKFLEKCPVLEELSLIDTEILQYRPICISSPKLKTLIILYRDKIMYGHDKTWCGIKVCCPELVSFEFIGHRGHLIFENVDRLKKAELGIMQQEISSELGNTGCKILDKISHVESLKLNLYFIQCIDVAGDRVPAYFKNLKTLEITTTIDPFTMNALIWILESSPNLESVHLIIQEEQLGMGYWATNEVASWKILTNHLVKVKFLGFKGEKHKCDIACCLLEHGEALEEMVFSWSDRVMYDEMSITLMNELSEFNKASSSMKLISVLKDE